ncbi:MAG: GNAT family N-acetyltransferase [Hyphomicrobiales bacterium]|nr:MAG: GNAT family N-acetyltransferase [Hyphomicrobiales bacterium]
MNIELTTSPAADDLEIMNNGLRAFEISSMPDLPQESEDIHVAAFARLDDGTIVGGIKASVYWDGLEIDVLWVANDQRGNRIASKLVEQIETFARSKGSVIAFLKTFDARGFYEKVGYKVFGILEDRPIGTILYHMKKRLNKS